MKPGDRILIEAEITEAHPEWVGVRIVFGRAVQNVKVPRTIARPARKAKEG